MVNLFMPSGLFYLSLWTGSRPDLNLGCYESKSGVQIACGAQLQTREVIFIIFFLFLHEDICCGYSLEAPWQGASNEYPQHMFSWRNKKDISIFWMKKVPYLLLCSENNCK